MNSLQVLTHNGKSVAEGGRRIGYSSGGMVTSICNYQPWDQFMAEWRSRSVQQAVPVVQVTTPDQHLLDYYNLPRLRRGDNCCACLMAVSSRFSSMTNTTVGQQWVITCPHCGTQMRER